MNTCKYRCICFLFCRTWSGACRFAAMTRVAESTWTEPTTCSNRYFSLKRAFALHIVIIWKFQTQTSKQKRNKRYILFDGSIDLSESIVDKSDGNNNYRKFKKWEKSEFDHHHTAAPPCESTRSWNCAVTSIADAPNRPYFLLLLLFFREKR